VLNILPLANSITHGVINPGDTEGGGCRTGLQAQGAHTLVVLSADNSLLCRT
jgi:hypothetical protein